MQKLLKYVCEEIFCEKLFYDFLFFFLGKQGQWLKRKFYCKLKRIWEERITLGWNWFWNQKILSNLTPLKWYRRFDFVKITASVTHCRPAPMVRAYLYWCRLGAQVTYSILHWVNIVTYLSGNRRGVDWSTLTLWDLSVR